VLVIFVVEVIALLAAIVALRGILVRMRPWMGRLRRRLQLQAVVSSRDLHHAGAPTASDRRPQRQSPRESGTRALEGEVERETCRTPAHAAAPLRA
jgi:hypothetical protein